MSNVKTYTSSLQDTINMANGNVSIGYTASPILSTIPTGVGIGTRTPLERLHVEGGSAYVSSNVIVGGDLVLLGRPLGYGIESVRIVGSNQVTLNPFLSKSVCQFDGQWVGGSNPARIVLPSQHDDGFVKELLLNASNQVAWPYTAQLYLGRLDGTYTPVSVSFAASNQPIQRRYTWSSNSWVAYDELVTKKIGANSTSFYLGDQEFTNAAGPAYVGVRIGWDNSTQDNRLAFRAMVKCTLASLDEVAYRQFEGIVSPVADLATSRPSGITYAEVGDLYCTTFSNLSQSIVRYNDNTVDVKVQWESTSLNYMATTEVQVVSSDRLGNFTFLPLHS